MSIRIPTEKQRAISSIAWKTSTTYRATVVIAYISLFLAIIIPGDTIKTICVISFGLSTLIGLIIHIKISKGQRNEIDREVTANIQQNGQVLGKEFKIHKPIYKVVVIICLSVFIVGILLAVLG